jgi:CRP-like cAMP-binding protein
VPEEVDVQDEKRALWFLKKIQLLQDLPAGAMARLAQRMEMRELRRRQVVYLPGDPGKCVYLLNGGRIKVSKVTHDGKVLTLSYCGPGDIFGELALIDGGPREEMAEVVDNALITEIELGEMEHLLTHHAQLGLRLVRILAGRRRELEKRLENLIFKDVPAKLADLLLRLATEFGVDDSRGMMVAIKITHQEMANLIGSTRETVSLTLSQFKRRGLIQTDGRRVIVADREGLRALL